MQIVSSLLAGIEGIYWFPVISLFIFLIIFGVMIVHTFSIKKSYADEVSRMPLDNDEPENVNEA